MLHRNAIVLASVLAGFVLACGPEATNGAGGSGGAGGTGGAGGAGGGGTAKDPAGPKDPDAALKAAILMGSCIPDGGIETILWDMYSERGGSPNKLQVRDYTKCLASKTNGCKGVEECLGLKVDLSGPCMPTCTGNVFKGCDDQLAFMGDCSVLGLTCSATQGCVDTSVTAGPACSYDTFVETCQDGVPRVCDDEVETNGPRCADYGLACKDLQFGGVGCAGTGATCQSGTESGLGIYYDSGLGCDGPELRACINGGEQAVDCGTLANGLTCQTSGESSFCGFAGECDPTLGADATCEGDSVVVCNAGRIDKVDCKTLGFTGCNATWGRCSPSIYDQFPAPQPPPEP
ncbi:hypothetical protein [Polyangium jinanense]|uniref:Lipoprotein n=1 Tax=Polyangium jinanense TaxID=2829994 RepID=A0A9X4AQ19_9BACT|nr:hypothetical protein [Polyangium jinanense]MDC3953015.1 hypothetical protein [Polyangium jinanense]MDC3980633.1 hypothetical protein [Polyangium jinanense]